MVKIPRSSTGTVYIEECTRVTEQSLTIRRLMK
jgi:hypothetical protein